MIIKDFKSFRRLLLRVTLRFTQDVKVALSAGATIPPPRRGTTLKTVVAALKGDYHKVISQSMENFQIKSVESHSNRWRWRGQKNRERKPDARGARQILIMGTGEAELFDNL